MEESAWLKNSATENLSGVWKPIADTAIDVEQGVALSPLLALSPGAYLAGTATNAAAEKMYEQTTDGKTAGDTLLSGLATAGWEVASEKVSDYLKKKGKSFSEWLEKVWDEYD